MASCNSRKKFDCRVAFADHSISDFYFNSKRLCSDQFFSLVVLGLIYEIQSSRKIITVVIIGFWPGKTFCKNLGKLSG